MSDVHGESHGNTVAAWSAVLIMIVGSVISGISVWFVSPVGFWIGIGVVVLGAITGKVLQVMGYGQEKPAALTEAN